MKDSVTVSVGDIVAIDAFVVDSISDVAPVNVVVDSVIVVVDSVNVVADSVVVVDSVDVVVDSVAVVVDSVVGVAAVAFMDAEVVSSS